MQDVVDQNLVRTLKNGKELADKIRKSVETLVTELQTHFDHSGYSGSGISFSDPDGPYVVSKVRTPFVRGRLALSMRFVGGRVVGVLDVQRACFDNKGAEYWEAVSRIVVPGVSNPCVETPDGQYEIQMDAAFGDDKWSSLCMAGMLILSSLLADD